FSSSCCASYAFVFMSLKNSKNYFVSSSSILSEQVSPSSLIVAYSANLSISFYFVSSMSLTKPISLFF
ncbi:MAG: hypothetical protein ACKO96_42375, partial [Flammeovirgaceae bacterium]